MNFTEYEWYEHEREQTKKMMAGVTLAGAVSALVWGVVILMFVGCAQASHSGKDMTKDFEGYSATIYVCPGGARTIGWGFNADDPTVAYLIPPDVRRGKRDITRAEAEEIFETLYNRAVEDAINIVGLEVFIQMAQKHRDVLIDMAYSLGRTRLKTFRDFKEALVNQDYVRAGEEIKNSKYYHQTGRRGEHHYQTFKGGAK